MAEGAEATRHAPNERTAVYGLGDEHPLYVCACLYLRTQHCHSIVDTPEHILTNPESSGANSLSIQPDETYNLAGTTLGRADSKT